MAARLSPPARRALIRSFILQAERSATGQGRVFHRGWTTNRVLGALLAETQAELAHTAGELHALSAGMRRMPTASPQNADRLPAGTVQGYWQPRASLVRLRAMRRLVDVIPPLVVASAGDVDILILKPCTSSFWPSPWAARASAVSASRGPWHG